MKRKALKKTPFKVKPTWKRLLPVSKDKRKARLRFVPPSIIKLIKERSGGQCEFVDSNGVRCLLAAEKTPHHLLKRSQGGGHTFSNLRDSCWPHNQFAETNKEESTRLGWNIPYRGYVSGSLED